MEQPAPTQGSVAEVCRLLETNLETWRIRKEIKTEVTKPGVEPGNIQRTVSKFMSSKGLATQVTNDAFTLGERLAQENAQDLSSTASPSKRRPATTSGTGCAMVTQNSPMEAIKEAQANWQELVVKRLNEYRVQSTMPLARRQRPESELLELRRKAPKIPWQRIGRPDAPYGYLPVPEKLSSMTIYGVDDLYRTVCAIGRVCPETGRALESTYREGQYGKHVPDWGSITLAIPTPSVAELQERYSELQEQNRQVGLDDCLYEWFDDDRSSAANFAAMEGSIPACRKLSRCGVPMGSRPGIWTTALCLKPFSTTDKLQFDIICKEVEGRQLLTDYMIASDVEKFVDTTEDYFLFSEQIRAVLLAFTRDTGVADACKADPHPQLVGMGKGGRRHGTYPPCGVLPFDGIALFCAPLCYLFKDPAELFRVFREMYCRHWCRLHSFTAVDCPSPCLPLLCRTFEGLLQEVEPEICWHLIRIECPPIKIAFPWLARAFVGYLQLDQVFLLWDRIVGYDSLVPLAMLAAAVMAFRFGPSPPGHQKCRRVFSRRGDTAGDPSRGQYL